MYFEHRTKTPETENTKLPSYESDKVCLEPRTASLPQAQIYCRSGCLRLHRHARAWVCLLPGYFLLPRDEYLHEYYYLVPNSQHTKQKTGREEIGRLTFTGIIDKRHTYKKSKSRYIEVIVVQNASSPENNKPGPRREHFLPGYLLRIHGTDLQTILHSNSYYVVVCPRISTYSVTWILRTNVIV